MKKFLNNIFDEATPTEIENLVCKNDVSDVSKDMLLSIKKKVYLKTGISFSKPKKNIFLRWQPYVAVSLCLTIGILFSIGLLYYQRELPVVLPTDDVTQTMETPVDSPSDTITKIDMGDVVFGTYYGGDQQYDDSYYKQATVGSIVITDSLKNAINNSDNPLDLFAVTVIEATSIDRNVIYNTFVQPLNVDEDYLNSGIVYLTQTQIESLKCPSEFALILSLAIKPYEEVVVDENYLEKHKGEMIPVRVYLDFDYGAEFKKINEQLSGLTETEYEKAKLKILKDRIQITINEFLKDHDVPNEAVDYVGVFICRFTAQLDSELILKMLDDPRISLIVENPYVPGVDLG